MAKGKSALIFEPNERVLCYHGPLLYEARCVEAKIDEGDGKGRYLIHYNGWNKSWDEWVDETRVLKWTDENLNTQKTLQNSASQSKKSKKKEPKKPATDEDTAKDSGKEKDSQKRPRKKAKLDGGVETEEEFMRRVEVKLPLPDDLRRLLVDDWDMVNNQKKLVKLPREPNVDKILKDYKVSKAKNPAFPEEIVGEVVDGLKTYFDHTLGTLLLFRFERPQYTAILEENKDKNMSDIYGAEHLLRLFVKLPMLLAHTNMEEESLKVLITHLQEFLKYLSKNATTLFMSEYEPASPEYCKTAN
eukprot:comp23742_c0_seq1/m.40978 comp23742_c0_seq1/g.40978  ORF comp23742_c0_seq1/g.40978 comp23742_c0_seq1/m.40978 type:complete len:302 (-) comp23742_c0_seq1:514-1419(-)